MILRSLTLAAGLAGAGTLSQFPEFSQQYAQRLGGAVDALQEVVDDFDASAAAAGLSRDAALSELTGTDFLNRRQTDMTATFTRHAKLQSDLAALNGAGPFMRAYHGARFTDPDIAKAAWAAYKPALPITFEGLVFAGVGFISGALALSLIAGALGRLFRRNRPA